MTEYDDTVAGDSGCGHCAPPAPLPDPAAPLPDPAPVAPPPAVPPVLDFPDAPPLDLGHGADAVQVPAAPEPGVTIVGADVGDSVTVGGPAPGIDAPGGDGGGVTVTIGGPAPGVDAPGGGGATVTVGGPAPGIDAPGGDGGGVTVTIGGPTPGVDAPGADHDPETLTFGGATAGLGPVGHGGADGHGTTVVTGDDPGGATAVTVPNAYGDAATWGFGRPGAGTPPPGFDPRSPVNDPDPNPTI